MKPNDDSVLMVLITCLITIATLLITYDAYLVCF